MAKKKTLTSAPGPSDIGKLSPQTKGKDAVQSTKSAIATAVAAATKENDKQRKERIAESTAKAKARAEDFKKWGQAELSRRITEYTNRYNTLITDIAKRGGVKNPQNATLVDQAEKLAKQLKDMDTTFKNLSKKQGPTRPTGVPADAKFDDKTKQWTRGTEKWDSAGKKVVTTKTGTDTTKTDDKKEDVTTKTGTDTTKTDDKKEDANKVTTDEDTTDAGAGKGTYTGAGDFDSPLMFNGKRFTGEYQGKKYENGILLPEKPEEKTVVYNGLGTAEEPLFADGKPFTGEYQGKQYKDGIEVIAKVDGGDGGDGGDGEGDGKDGVDTLKPDVEKIFAEAVKLYGDIDEIFKTNPELRTLLEGAIGKVDDPNDDYTEGQFLNLLRNTDWWKSQAGIVRQRGFLKRQYQKLVRKLDKHDPNYAVNLEKLNAENEYGRGLNSVYNSLQSMAQGMGADLTTEQLNSLASKVYNLGYEGDDGYLTRLLTPYVSTAGLVGGTAGQTLQALRQTARANGFDLDTKFGAQMNEWVRQVNNGRNIDDFKNIIREEAAKGQGKYVTDLLRSGYDLDGIYGNYISLMAKNFNIDPTTIKLDDPLLKNIFNDQGGIKFNDFENVLRSDARYQGTPGMASEKDLRQSIADRAVGLGIKLQDSDIGDIANNILSMGIGATSSLVDGLIRAKFRYAPGVAIGGFAGNNLAALKQTAEANGLDLDKSFTQSEVQSWLSNILQGESIETYKRRIRQTAGAGLPDKISALLDLGSDLESIYAPYKNIMASTLEISPETIRLNDPVLRQAIGQEKEMSIYEWERFLRKDPRWQYTNQARADVSDAIRTVAQDFGLAG
jgi:hypothetical protein